MIPDFSGLVTDRLGVNFSTVETNPNGAGISTMESMTPSQYAAMQQSVETIYDLFTSRGNRPQNGYRQRESHSSRRPRMDRFARA